MRVAFELVALGPERSLLPVRVQPGASRARVIGTWNGRLKIAVHAKPEGGRANAELVELVAELLDLARSEVSLVAGERSRDKRLALALGAEAARARLLAHLR